MHTATWHELRRGITAQMICWEGQVPLYLCSLEIEQTQQAQKATCSEEQCRSSNPNLTTALRKPCCPSCSSSPKPPKALMGLFAVYGRSCKSLTRPSGNSSTGNRQSFQVWSNWQRNRSHITRLHSCFYQTQITYKNRKGFKQTLYRPTYRLPRFLISTSNPENLLACSLYAARYACTSALPRMNRRKFTICTAQHLPISCSPPPLALIYINPILYV
jgi:hypothetical protein